MKKRILAIFTIIAVFGLAIAAFAYTQTSTSTTASASCCKDSCPMKNMDGNHAEHGKDHAKGEGHKGGDSCPMKGDHAKGGEHHAKGDAHNCCGDSCPMKKKDGQATATAASATEDGKSCCDNCECCKGKAKTETAAV